MVSRTAQRILQIALLVATLPLFAEAPPERTGPEGLLLWGEPRDIAQVTFKNEGGDVFSWSDFSGQFVLVNIWATWCGPCREEMPTLDELQARLGGPGFEVVALSLDRKGADAVTEFYQEIGVEHLGIYVDETGMAGSKLKAIGIPTTLLLNTEGKEIGRLVGTAEWDSEKMVEFLRDLIS